MSKRALDRTEIEEETESEERSYRFEDNEHLVSVATKRSIFFLGSHRCKSTGCFIHREVSLPDCA
jgi:hypothetical protein